MKTRELALFDGKTIFFTVILVIFLLSQALPLIAQSPIRIPTNLSQIKVVTEVPPVYPPGPKAAFYEAVVSVESTIDDNGIVTDAIVTNVSINENEELRKKVITEETESDETLYEKQARLDQYQDEFSAAALEAAKKWRFEPFTSNGEKVTVAYPFDFKFTLKIAEKQETKAPVTDVTEEGEWEAETVTPSGDVEGPPAVVEQNVSGPEE